MTKEEIKMALLKGATGEYSYLLICCDTFDWEDFPVYVRPNQNIDDIISYYMNSSTIRIIEIYNYNLSLDEQLNEYRANNIYPKPKTFINRK